VAALVWNPAPGNHSGTYFKIGMISTRKEPAIKNSAIASTASIGVVIRTNVDAVRHRYCGRTHKANIKEMRNMLTRDIANGNARADMLQKTIGLLQKLTEETPDIQYITRLVDTGIRRIKVFCEYPATCPPDIPVGKPTEGKSPARSTAISVRVLSPKYDTSHAQFVEHGKVGPN
jgi:hypothetical protein